MDEESRLFHKDFIATIKQPETSPYIDVFCKENHYLRYAVLIPAGSEDSFLHEYDMNPFPITSRPYEGIIENASGCHYRKEKRRVLNF